MNIVHFSHVQQLQDKYDFDLLYNWSLSNQLNFNISKCTNLSFNNKICTSYQINSTPLPRLSPHHDLGLLFSHDLSWSNQYQQISAEAYTNTLGVFLKVVNLHRPKATLHYAGSIPINVWFTIMESLLD